MKMSCLCLFIAAFVAHIGVRCSDFPSAAGFPQHIPRYGIRKDFYSQHDVSRGRLELIGGLVDKYTIQQPFSGKKYSLLEFKKALQCAPFEDSDIDGLRGTISLMKLMPPTKRTLEIVCAWAESDCGDWKSCRALADKYKNDNTSYSHVFRNSMGGFKGVRLLRLINSTLYTDWPWGRDRLDKDTSINTLLLHIVHKIRDLPDIAFFMGGEQYALPYHFPVPLLSYASSFKSGDIPWPWPEQFRAERRLYLQATRGEQQQQHNNNGIRNNNNRHNNKQFHNYSEGYNNLKPWNKRKSKAVYYGELNNIRKIFFQQAALHPDLFEAGWPDGIQWYNIQPSSPSSTEPDFPDTAPVNVSLYTKPEAESSLPGSLYSLLKVRVKEFTPYNPGQFKYVVVLQGYNGASLSGRLGALLAHSGCVVLLQHSEFSYHFSGRLIPWVHYVPLTYTAADVVEKVKWLVAHDDLAQQIAENGRNFGLSYLRIEDLFCYGASVLETIANIEKGSDVLIPFNATLAVSVMKKN